jgi:hypothetical protein
LSSRRSEIEASSRVLGKLLGLLLQASLLNRAVARNPRNAQGFGNSPHKADDLKPANVMIREVYFYPLDPIKSRRIRACAEV